MTISKKIPLMAFVLGLGLLVSMSSFVKSGLKAGQSSVTYYHYSDTQNFTQTVPGAGYTGCATDNAAWCRVTYSGPTASLPTATSFAEGSIPAAASGVTRTLIDQNKGYFLQ